MIEAGKLAPRLDPQRFALADAQAAHDAVAAGSMAGKVVVSCLPQD